MTATCTLCNELLTVPDDLSARSKTLAEIGRLFHQHLANKHFMEPQTAFDAENVKCSVAQLLDTRMAPVMGFTLQGAILYSYLQSDDPLFEEGARKLREMILKSMEQKQPQVIVTP